MTKLPHHRPTLSINIAAPEASTAPAPKHAAPAETRFFKGQSCAGRAPAVKPPPAVSKWYA